MTSRVPADVKRGPLSASELEAIAEMGERRVKAGTIARKLNRHPVTVSYAMHRLGVRTLARRTFCYVRGGRVVKSFSPEEDALLLKLRVAGETPMAIAAKLGETFGHPRSDHTVRVRLVLLNNAPDQVAA